MVQRDIKDKSRPRIQISSTMLIDCADENNKAGGCMDANDKADLESAMAFGPVPCMLT